MLCGRGERGPKKLARDHAQLTLAAREAGVINSQQFATFFNAGHRGLYTETMRQIQQRKGLRPRQDIGDWMGPLQLSANDFRAELARQMILDRKHNNASAANATHAEAGGYVRTALLSAAILPETLPTPTRGCQETLREEEARQRMALRMHMDFGHDCQKVRTRARR